MDLRTTDWFGIRIGKRRGGGLLEVNYSKIMEYDIIDMMRPHNPLHEMTYFMEELLIWKDTTPTRSMLKRVNYIGRRRGRDDAFF